MAEIGSAKSMEKTIVLAQSTSGGLRGCRQTTLGETCTKGMTDVDYYFNHHFDIQLVSSFGGALLQHITPASHISDY
ncbi:MAG: hypothetical protein FJ045_00740 [Crenarchaeota archaeon]|nr:hypothetical protein [Thermoproteota archaeon]